MNEYIIQKRKAALRAYTISIPLILAAGIACIVIKSVFSDKFIYSDMIASIGVGLIAAGLVILVKFLYWRKNREAHEKLLQDEKIRFSDERKIMLRQKSGLAAYQITFFGLCILNLIFIFTGADMTIISAVWIFLLADALLGIVLFKYYSGKM
ncbi:MAG: hypothetical protein LBU81_07785 [Methanosarcinales archaeon]|jgi:ABC-type uncharacterized transport system permease subunit|nr:hypothetical protein [Methanosarcinales archaeon]